MPVSRKVYERELCLPATADAVYAWHERPGALDRLLPPWESVEIIDAGKGVRDTSQVVLRQHLGPLRLRWVAEHHDCARGKQFCDIQRSGPFKFWDHMHQFEPCDGGSVLRDRIEYELPGGVIGAALGDRYVRQKLESVFAYRHRTTSEDVSLLCQHRAISSQRVLISGSHGLIGRALVPFLTAGGHQVVRLVRGAAQAGEASWLPDDGVFPEEGLGAIDVVVHLAGENIAASRWSSAAKERIRESRVRATRVLCEGMARLPKPPRVLVSASAIGIYGDRGDSVLDEATAPGTGFLADVAQAWETATRPAAAAGIRVVPLRFAMVLSPTGGALKKMLPAFRAGLGGRVGSGRQYWCWISLDDAVGAIYHAMMTDSITGPVNAVSPGAVTNREFTRILARVVRRPAWFPLPAFAARLALGAMADEVLLASTRVVPRRLMESGYRFRHEDLEDALRHMLGRVT